MGSVVTFIDLMFYLRGYVIESVCELVQTTATWMMGKVFLNDCKNLVDLRITSSLENVKD